MAWLGAWKRRVEITIDSGDIDAALSNFPVLIHLSTSCGINSEDLSFVFDELQNDANRKKIAVTEDDGTTECYVEIEKWDDANEKAWLWVKVPSIASGADTTIYLYYDRTHADNGARVGDPSDAVVHNVWDTDFTLVSHLRDDPDTSHVRDSTQYGNDGTKKGAGEPAVTTDGKIDGAQLFDGDDDYIGHGNDASLNPTTAVTFEAWVKPTGDTGTTLIAVGKWDNIDRSHKLYLADSGENTWLAVFVAVANSTVSAVSTTTLNINTEYYIAGTYDGSNIKIYLNGTLEHSPALIGNLRVSGSPLYLGIEPNGGVPQWFFYGIIDEVRVSKNLDRSATWIKASYESQRDHLLDFGAEETGFTVVPKTWGIDAVFKALGIEETLDVDAAFRALGIENAFDIDALFVLRLELARGIDAAFQRLGIERTADVDAAFLLRLGLSFGLDTRFVIRHFISVSLASDEVEAGLTDDEVTAELTDTEVEAEVTPDEVAAMVRV